MADAKGPAEVLDGKEDTYILLDDQREFVMRLAEPAKINRLMLQEAIAEQGERVESFAVDAQVGGEWQEIATATNIGYKRILRFPDVETDAIRFRLLDARLAPAISNVAAYYYHSRPPRLSVVQDAEGRVTITPKRQDFGWNRNEQNAAENLSAGYQIYYTTDGTEPDSHSTLYAGPVYVEDCTVKAVAMLGADRGPVCTEVVGWPKHAWTLAGVSSEDPKHKAQYAFDANPDTYWSSAASPSPHFIEIDLGSEKSLTGFAYVPQRHHSQGMLSNGKVCVSEDGKQWKEAATFEFGNLVNDPTKRFCQFPSAVSARYVRIEATGTEAGSKTIAVAELDLY